MTQDDGELGWESSLPPSVAVDHPQDRELHARRKTHTHTVGTSAAVMTLDRAVIYCTVLSSGTIKLMAR